MFLKVVLLSLVLNVSSNRSSIDNSLPLKTQRDRGDLQIVVVRHKPATAN